jgi:hypothetical protein
VRQSALMVAVAVGIGVGAVVLAGFRLNDAEIVTPLPDPAVGPPALDHTTVEQELFRTYQPLPGFGGDLRELGCPGPLAAVVGTTMTCTGRTFDDLEVDIVTRVVRVEQGELVWRYEVH